MLKAIGGALFIIALLTGLAAWYYSGYTHTVQAQAGLLIIPRTEDVVLTVISADPVKRIDYLIRYDKRQVHLVDTLLMMFPQTTYLPCKIEVAK